LMRAGFFEWSKGHFRSNRKRKHKRVLARIRCAPRRSYATWVRIESTLLQETASCGCELPPTNNIDLNIIKTSESNIL